MGESRLEDLASPGFAAPLARVGLLLTWAFQFIIGIVTGFLSADNPASWIAYFLAIPALLLATISPRTLNPLLGEWTAVALTVLIGALTLFVNRNGDPAGLLYLGAFSLTILATRGKLAAAALGLACLVVMLLCWGFLTAGSPAELVERLLITVCVVGMGFVARLHINRVTARGLLQQAELAAARSAADVAAKLAQRTTGDLRSVREDALPILEILQEHGRIGSANLQQLVTTEALVRDRIRVPRLHTPELYRAIRHARDRLVSVHLIGEATDARPTISAALGQAVAEQLMGMRSGAVTIRIPPGRPTAEQDGVALTVRLSTGSEATLLSFDDGGKLIEVR